MKTATARIGGAAALAMALVLSAPSDVRAQQVSTPQGSSKMEERPTVTLNIVSGDLSGQEKRDFDLVERAMRDIQTRGYAGLAVISPRSGVPWRARRPSTRTSKSGTPTSGSCARWKSARLC